MACRTALIRVVEGRVNRISGTENKLLVSVSQCAVTQAEQAIEACQLCTLDAPVSFSSVLLSFRGYHADQVELILPHLAHCPRCGRDVNESTFIKPKRKPGRILGLLLKAIFSHRQTLQTYSTRTGSAPVKFKAGDLVTIKGAMPKRVGTVVKTYDFEGERRVVVLFENGAESVFFALELVVERI